MRRTRRGTRPRDRAKSTTHEGLLEEAAALPSGKVAISTSPAKPPSAPTTVRVVDELDVALLVVAFPETARPVNRHVERLAAQRDGAVTALAAWDDALPIGYVFIRWPGHDGAGLTPPARALGCAELADLAVAANARRRGAGLRLVEAAEALVQAAGLHPRTRGHGGQPLQRGRPPAVRAPRVPRRCRYLTKQL